MANIYYTQSGYPATGGTGSSASMRAELALIQLAFDKLPVPTGNANKLVAINASGTSMTVASGVLATSLVVQDPTDTTKQAQFSLASVTTGTTRTLTVPDASDTLALIATAQTLSNKTLASPTLTGNTLISSSAARIQGDFSNATVANRTLFQDKTANTVTSVGAIPNGTAASAQFTVWNNSDPTNASFGYLYADAGAVQLGSSKTGSGSYLPLQFLTNNTEAGRVTTGGAWGFGGTSINNTNAGVLNVVGIASRNGTGGSCAGNTMNLYWSSPNAYLYVDGSNLGAISISSDYRVKQNVVTQTANAVDRINALRPVQYQFKDAGELFKADGVTREGFIAHELQAVIPSAVFGAKDELTKDGEIQPQSLKLDALVSVLTKAVQELSARVATLEAV